MQINAVHSIVHRCAVRRKQYAHIYAHRCCVQYCANNSHQFPMYVNNYAHGIGHIIMHIGFKLYTSVTSSALQCWHLGKNGEWRSL